MTEKKQGVKAKPKAEVVSLPGMTIRLPDAGQKTYEVEGTKFFYRMATPGDVFAISRLATTVEDNGNIKYNEDVVFQEVLKRCILGWENLYAEDDAGERKPLEFKTEYIPALPVQLQLKLWILIDYQALLAGGIDSKN